MSDRERERAPEEDIQQVDPDFYRYIFQFHPLPAWIYDQETLRFLAVNQAAVVEYGYSEQEFLEMRITDIRAEKDRQILLKFLEGPVGSHETSGPWHHRRRDNSEFTVTAYSHDLIFRGRPGRLVIINDISERERLQQDVRLLAAAVAGASESVMITDGILNPPGPHIIFVNAAFTNMTRFTAEQVIGKSPAILHGAKTDRIPCQQIARDLEQSASVTYSSVNYRADGSEYTVEWEVTPLRDAEGTVTHYLSLQRDVTERNRLQEQFQQAQKMEAVGRLAGGIAHDFNNILTIILGYSGLLSVELAKSAVPDERFTRSLQEIQKAAEKAVALTSQLLSFSRKQVARTRIIEMNPVVANLESMLHRLIGEDIDLELKLDPNIGCVQADPGQVEQVLMNLAVNARDAMPRGGKLTICTATVNVNARYTPVTPLKAGFYILLSVSDTGHGMDEATRSRIFEPFFTTKEAGKGTGLGLSMVYNFTKQNGGHIEAESELGSGTTFNLYLPRVESQADLLSVPQVKAKVRGTGTVLIVEDDSSIREMVRHVLRGAGFMVYTASNAQQAIDFAGSHKGVIDLLLTDVVMPGASGPDLAKTLRDSRPSLKVLYSSGYSDHALLPEKILEPGAAFVQKPFNTDALLSLIHKMLTSKSSNVQAR